MKRVAVIGAGVSGLTIARLLRDRCSVTVFEREQTPGGLIRCNHVNGSLFHLCGGHVFNTKNQDVLNWFWSIFNRDRDFVKADRKSAVCMTDGTFVDYPIENHIYQLSKALQAKCYADIRAMLQNPPSEALNFGDFLEKRFGRTLYDLYFKPYNDKIWKQDLFSVPLSWLSGKLPMPTPGEILEANERRLDEKTFVHSSFYYAKENGSQFIADLLATGSDVLYDRCVTEILPLADGRCRVNGETFDEVVFCGNLKELPDLLKFDLRGYREEIEALAFHGTTAVFCETDPIPYSWFYQPSPHHASHRFICTGNFSPRNNGGHKMTCTVEFTDYISEEDVRAQLKLMPYHPKYLEQNFSKFTYPIQRGNTRDVIVKLKDYLRPHHIHLVGRFAEWEYFNMDAAMASAMTLCGVLGS